jgi:hypothetical protein
LKGFTKDHKFIPMTDYKKVTRKSRDQKAKTQGIRLAKNGLDSHQLMMTKFRQEEARRDRFASPKWNSMTQAERLRALNKAGVFESAMGQKLQSREELSKLPYHELPHYAKTDLGFHFFNLNKEGKPVRKARTVSIPKFHRVKEQEDGLVKFWAESSDSKTVASLVQSNKFPEEMEIRISLPNFESITVRGSKDILDNFTFDEFLDKTKMHLEREQLMREKREPFPVGERRPTGLGDQDVIEAISGKKLTQTDLIAMQRATRKKGDLSDEDFQRRQEIVRKLNDAKFNVDKVAKRKIDPTNEQQFNKKSRALGRANDKLAIQKQKFKKEFGVEVVDI